MRYDGDKLLSILREQADLIVVHLPNGTEVPEISPQSIEVLSLAKSGSYFGIGNWRRIRFLRFDPDTLRDALPPASINNGSRFVKRPVNDARKHFAPRHVIEHKSLPPLTAVPSVRK